MKTASSLQGCFKSSFTYTGASTQLEASEVKPEDLIGQNITMTIKRTNANGEEEIKTQKLKVTGVLKLLAAMRIIQSSPTIIW